jgi:hypothetical protein
MRLVLLYPPLVIPTIFRPPATCDRCGSVAPFVLHQWQLEAVPYVLARGATATQSLVQARAPRFRCRGTDCNRTVAAHLFSRQRGTLAHPYVQARVAALYCLGVPVAEILQTHLGDGSPDIQLDRAGLYRIVERVDDDRLQQLHVLNRRRPLQVEPPTVKERVVNDPEISRYPVRYTTSRVQGRRGVGRMQETVVWLEEYFAKLRTGAVLRERRGQTVVDEDRLNKKVRASVATMLAAHRRPLLDGSVVAPLVNDRSPQHRRQRPLGAGAFCPVAGH